MPSRNVIRVDIGESYYHIYARGASQSDIFLEHYDYQKFLDLFARYLSNKPAISKEGVAYPHFKGRVELLSYSCLPNHFHLLLYQHNSGDIAKFMSSLMTSYSRYFNLKYKRTGSLFESRYKSSRINADNYLDHISRYIHLNTRYWKKYPYSSYKYYFTDTPEWLKPRRVLDLFADNQEYTKFLEDYMEHKAMLDELKYELAI